MPRKAREVVELDDPEARSRQEEYLRQHVFDRWRDSLPAMGRINELLSIGQRIVSGQVDESQGGRRLTADDFDTKVDEILEDQQMEDILLTNHPGTGKSTLAIIRWMVGLVTESPYTHEN